VKHHHLPIWRTLAAAYRDLGRLMTVMQALALAPWLAVSMAGVLLLGRDVMTVGSPRMMLFLLMGGVLQTILLSLTAVIASYAFMVLAARVKRAS
jgi:hypothetical protein